MIKKLWLKIFPNFRCNICGENKVSFLARWFGLYHCEDCENKAIIQEIEKLGKQNGK